MKTIYYLLDIKSNDIAIVFAAENDEVAKRTIASAIANMKKNQDLLALNVWKDCLLQKVQVKDVVRVEGLDLSALCEYEAK